MVQQINEITKVPSNATVIKILNQIIKRYNSLGNLYQYKGSVQTYDDLLAIQNPQIGDVYNVIQEDAEEGIAAGSNFVWDGTVWDNLGGSLTGVVQSVNGINPDNLGNVLLPLIKNVTAAGGNIVFTKNDNTNVNVNNVKKLYTVQLGQTVGLNNLVEAGIYMCGNDSYAANYENCPVQKSFLLEVQQANDESMVYQFLTQYNDGSTEAGNQYVRTYQVTNGWSAWRIAGSGSNLTTYTSLEQLEITRGQETFASIHNALPINSALEYYASEAQNFADIYPASYGNFTAIRLTGDITIFHFTGTNQIIYVTHYHVTNNTNPSWTQIAKQSDLTNLSNSVVKSVNGIKPTNGNVAIDIPKPVIASEAEAKAGTDNTKFMSPLRVKQAISALAGDSSWTISKGTNGWARENSTGLTVQWGYVNRSGSGTFTFPRTFTTCYYSNVMCSSNLESFITARSNTSIAFNTCNGYNDDIQNWGNCYIFAIGVS